MTKPRTVTAVVNAILAADPSAHVQVLRGRIVMSTCSAAAYVDLKEEIDLPIISANMEAGGYGARPRGQIAWDRSPIPDPDAGRVKPYALKDSAAQKRVEDTARQEEDAARLIGGRRHPGSGALEDLKSDGSSRVFQTESKQTAARSLSLTVEVLNKIHVEAKSQRKTPMVHLRFSKVPSEMTMPEDWVVIPAEAFERMVKLCGWGG